MGDDGDTPTYPQLAEKGSTANNWEPAALHNCTKERMLAIAKDFELENTSGLNKVPLFKAIYNHMLTVQACTICEGDCNPTEHLFPANCAPPAKETAPTPTNVTTPRGSRRGAGELSPNSRLIQNDESPDELLGDLMADGGLFEGQNVETPEVEEVSLADNIIRGAMGVTQSFPRLTLRDIAKDQERIRKEMERKEKEDDERREKELAAKRSKQPSQASIKAAIKDKRTEATKLYLQRKKAKEAQHKKDLAALDQPPRRVPVNARSKQPSRPRMSEPLDEFTLDLTDGEDEPDDDDDVIDAPDTPLTAKNMMKLLDRYMNARDEKQKKNQRSMSLGSADLRGIDAIPVGAPNTGKMALRAVENKSMADRLGLAPMPNLAIEGDPTDLDLTKIKKYMQSGANRTPGQFVERQTTWPEQCLTPAAPGFKKSSHAQLNLTEFVEGYLGKFLLETRATNLDPILANKLTYLRNLLSMHHTLDLKSIISISDRFLTGWENKSFEWSDWSRIDEFLKEARFQELVNSMAGKSGGPRAGADGNGKGGAPPPNGSSNIHGVPTEFLRDNKLCIKFNNNPKSCSESGDHPQQFKKHVTLLHNCAGCMKFGKTSGEGHGVSTCPNGPYGKNKSSFRK